MTRNEKHVPIRTCISCGAKRPKKELIRLVLDSDGWVVRDLKGSAHGRGAYVCNREECLTSLKDGKRLKKAFKGKGKCMVHPLDFFPKQN